MLKNNLKKKFYSSMFFDEFIKRDLFTNKGLLLEEPKKVWAFNAGNTFTGNPKWLFIYVNKYRKDIDAYWLCDNVETVDYIRSLGYKAYCFNAGGGIEVKNRAGVFVTEQVKEQIPVGMENAILLNLYHGVGCKTIERKLKSGYLAERVIQKYIRNGDYFSKNMLFLVTSPLMEKHFMTQVGVDENYIIRAGYPRCEYQKYYPKISTFNHSIIDKKKLNKATRVVAYAPTFRETKDVDLMNSAVPDMKKLEAKLKKNNMLFIFKMHPFVENDVNYIKLKEKYQKSPYFLFWDNNNDFYEVMDRVDIAVTDYSSIFYDFLAAGVKKFIRYFFDYDNPENVRDFAFDCKEMTCGKICNNFEEFLSAFDSIDSDDGTEADRERLYDLFWQYSGEDTFENIIETTLNFVPESKNEKTLYSFDIFDTIISRKGLDPKSIFYKVKEKLEKSDLNFPRHLIENYVSVRVKSEQNAREYMQKTLYVRKNDEREVTLDDIIERISVLYALSDEQKRFLIDCELDCELEDTVPIDGYVSLVEGLIDSGEDVILISDMYLPKAQIVGMLEKVSEKISKLPLYLSSEYKVQKSTGKLFLEVYKSMPNYDYGKWIHYGDNKHADVKMPNKIGIETVHHTAATFSEYEKSLVEKIGTYDAFLVAAKMARFRAANKNSTDYFCYAYASLMFVPYVYWAVKDAENRGLDTLYFISRDGHHLKRIADEVIKATGSTLKTKYIYGSRKAWRIPSFIDEFDESFFLPFGNVAAATNFKSLLKSLSIDYETFIKIFPNLSYLKSMKKFSKQTRKTIISILSNSEEYRNYLLNFAKEKRVIIDRYFNQEMDFGEKFAFVEYWGRGYTQTCHTRLLQNVAGEKIDVPYYYMRSIYPSIGNDIRYNFTDSNTSLIFAEALFANIDYKSIEEYTVDKNDRVVPVKRKADCDMYLLSQLNERLVQFTKDYMALPIQDRDTLGRQMLSFALDYFNNNQNDEVIIETIAPLIDAVGLFGDKREFAPVLTKEDLDRLYIDKTASFIDITSSVEMSVARSDKEVQDYYYYLTVVLPQEKKDLKAGKKTKYNAKAVDFNNKLHLMSVRNIKDKNSAVYNKKAKLPVKNTAVFFGESVETNENYISLIKALAKKDYIIESLPYKEMYSSDELEIMATAKYIFCDKQTLFLSLIKFRKETEFVRIYGESFPVNKFGVQDIEYGKRSDFRLKSKLYNANCDLIPIAGEGLKNLFEKSFKKGEKVIKPIGTPSMDLYSDEDFVNGAREKANKLYPKDKKIILYLPCETEDKASTFDYIDFKALRESLSDEYILVTECDTPKFVRDYAKSESGFVYLADGSMSVRELIIVSDIVIGDFSSYIFEAIANEKPVIFTGLYESEKALVSHKKLASRSGAVVADDSYELISAIKNISAFSSKRYKEFNKKYFSGFKGNTAERIIKKDGKDV